MARVHYRLVRSRRTDRAILALFPNVGKLTFAALVVLSAASKAVFASFALFHVLHVTTMFLTWMSTRVSIPLSTVFLLTLEIIAVVVLLFFLWIVTLFFLTT